MLCMSRFFLRRLIIALAATVPLLAILAWTLSRGVDDSRDTAYRQILAKSRVPLARSTTRSTWCRTRSSTTAAAER